MSTSKHRLSNPVVAKANNLPSVVTRPSSNVDVAETPTAEAESQNLKKSDKELGVLAILGTSGRKRKIGAVEETPDGKEFSSAEALDRNTKFKSAELEDGEICPAEETTTAPTGKTKRRRNHSAANQKKRFGNQMKRWVESALLEENTVRYNDFDLEREIDQLETGKPPTIATTFNRVDGTTSRSGRDCKGRLLWVCLPQAIGEKSLVELNKALIDFRETRKAASNPEGVEEVDAPNANVENFDSDVINIVLAWNEIGLSHEPPEPSPDMMGTTGKFTATCKLLCDLPHLDVRLNTILEHIDRRSYDAAISLRTKLIKDNAYLKGFIFDDGLLWQGRSITFNHQAPAYQDLRGNRHGWTPLVCLGDTKQGDVRMFGIGEDIYYEAGTILFIRGASMKHEVRNCEGQQQMAITHFTPGHLWENNGIPLPL